MTRSVRLHVPLTLLAGATSLFAAPAGAWDSSQNSHIHAVPKQDWTPRFGTTQPRFYMHVLKDAIGGHPGDDDPNTKLLRCAPTILDPGGAYLPDCSVASAEELNYTKAQWLTSRMATDLPHGSEHMLISRAAAERAGLLRDLSSGVGPSIFERFWLRYSARPALVGSYIPQAEARQPDESLPERDVLVGQSFFPAPLNQAGTSFVLRSVSLLELSHLADFSHNLSDWAMGNEACPITGAEQAYKDVDPIEACHQFKAVMGMVNVTHFAPLNRDVWEYYHGLALAKMQECRSYEGFKETFYDYYESWAPNHMSGSATEAHDCERMAMTYEMFAQHFLQDAWSSGHMWRGWGYPRYTDFPTHFDIFPDEDRPHFDARSEPARRAIIGALVAAARGMIHGTKALLVDAVRDKGWGVPANLLSPYVSMDDPLNGGFYKVLENDEWRRRDVLWLGNDGSLSPGAGDLFWDPAIVTDAVVSQQFRYFEQRDTMLDCSAKSMLDVYQAGLRAHGQELPVSPSVNAIDLYSGKCWAQRATNASMRAALGPVDLAYVNNLSGALSQFGLPSLGGSLLGHVNDLIIATAGDTIANYPFDLASERKAFKDRAARRLTDDWRLVRDRYMTNSEDNANGSASANQIDAEGPSPLPRISFLDVLPMEESGFGNPPRDVDYLDRLPGPSASTDAELALSRVFWRGDLQQTCRLGGLEELRARCIAGATVGGDPEACTQCVALAELHIPRCTDDVNVMGPSKCTRLGTEVPGAVGPAWWWDSRARHFEFNRLPAPFNREWEPCGPAIDVALQWCTENPSDRAYGGAYRSSVLHSSITARDACGLFSGAEYAWGTVDYRDSRYLAENASDGEPWLYPMAVGFDYSITTSPNASICDFSDDTRANSREYIVQANIDFSDTSAYATWFGPGAEVPRCGIQQRAFYWNRDCSEARVRMPFNLPLGMDNNSDDPETGAAIWEVAGATGTHCKLRDERRFVAACPGGFNCSVGGECVAGFAPDRAMIFLESGQRNRPTWTP